MRTRIILGLTTMLALAAGLAYHVTQSDARWHILSETAINTNRLCSDGLRYTWGSGATETQPSAVRPVGAPGWAGPVDLLVQHAPTTTPSTEDDWFNAPMAGADVFQADYRPVRNTSVSPAIWYPYSHSGVVPFRSPLTPATESVRLDTEPNGNQDAADAFEAVGNCTLFAPMDFKPAQSPNIVDLSIDGKPTAAFLSTSTYDATKIAAGSVRFGVSGSEAAPLTSALQDVNADGRQDLVLSFKRSQTGIVCATTQVEMSAIDPGSGKRFYESDSVQTTNCPP
jgi:hypothetical protein